MGSHFEQNVSTDPLYVNFIFSNFKKNITSSSQSVTEGRVGDFQHNKILLWANKEV